MKLWQAVWLLRPSCPSTDPEAFGKTLNHTLLRPSVWGFPQYLFYSSLHHIASNSGAHLFFFFDISELRMHPAIDSQSVTGGVVMQFFLSGR